MLIEERKNPTNKKSQRRPARAFHVIAQAGETSSDGYPTNASQPTTLLSHQADRIEHPEPLQHLSATHTRQPPNSTNCIKHCLSDNTPLYKASEQTS
jgi:hypothetical protein